MVLFLGGFLSVCFGGCQSSSSSLSSNALFFYAAAGLGFENAGGACAFFGGGALAFAPVRLGKPLPAGILVFAGAGSSSELGFSSELPALFFAGLAAGLGGAGFACFFSSTASYFFGAGGFGAGGFCAGFAASSSSSSSRTGLVAVLVARFFLVIVGFARVLLTSKNAVPEAVDTFRSWPSAGPGCHSSWAGAYLGYSTTL